MRGKSGEGRNLMPTQKEGLPHGRMNRESNEGQVAAHSQVPGKEHLQETHLCPHVGEVKHGALVPPCLVLGV